MHCTAAVVLQGVALLALALVMVLPNQCGVLASHSASSTGTWSSEADMWRAYAETQQCAVRFQVFTSADVPYHHNSNADTQYAAEHSLQQGAWTRHWVKMQDQYTHALAAAGFEIDYERARCTGTADTCHDQYWSLYPAFEKTVTMGCGDNMPEWEDKYHDADGTEAREALRVSFARYWATVMGPGSRMRNVLGNSHVCGLHTVTPFIQGLTSASPDAPVLHADDRAVLASALGATTAAGWCDLPAFGCAHDPNPASLGGNLRVVAIDLGRLPGESTARTTSDVLLSRYFANLPALHAIAFGWNDVGGSGAARCAALKQLPHVKRLTIGGTLPRDCALPELKHVKLACKAFTDAEARDEPDGPDDIDEDSCKWQLWGIPG